MSLKIQRILHWRRGVTGAVLAVTLGLAFWRLPIGGGLARMSYELPFLFKTPVALDGLLSILYMDEASFQRFQQTPGRWSRSLHAQLLDGLTKDGARVVVFDLLFADAGDEPATAELLRAMKANGKVVLGAEVARDVRRGFRSGQVIPPLPIFQQAAAGWGAAAVLDDSLGAIQQYGPGTENEPSLPWMAAQLAGAPVTREPGVDLAEHYLNYYGPYGALPAISYGDWQIQSNGFFLNKIVFVGSRAKTRYALDETDEFRTPWTRWGDGFSPGVDLAATAFLNLWRHEWLTRMPQELELAVVIACGVVLGFGLSAARPLLATVGAILSVLGVAFAALFLMHREHVWFSWLLVAGVEIPSALAWSVLGHRMRFLQALEPARTADQGSGMGEESPTVADTSRLLTPSGAQAAPAGTGGTRKIAMVSDHTLLRCVGRGAYGEVWLARDVIGTFHAVKIVYRNSFDNEEPYEREFHGLQKYTPISRTHPGWVHMLHIGRNDAEGFFFCIMEAGDDEVSGQEIDPNSYQPRNLARELKKHGRLPIDECVRLGVALAEALEHLHRHRLIHRDIKPSNVIFVKGVPKFADIGLVTELKGADGEASYLGTEGYIAPEGPGTASADVYSLGKLLYEISMGRDRREFPELPTVVLGRPETPHLRRLQKIVMRACAEEPLRRYQSADALSADLRELQRGLEAGGPRG